MIKENQIEPNEHPKWVAWFAPLGILSLIFTMTVLTLTVLKLINYKQSLTLGGLAVLFMAIFNLPTLEYFRIVGHSQKQNTQNKTAPPSAITIICVLLTIIAIAFYIRLAPHPSTAQIPTFNIEGGTSTDRIFILGNITKQQEIRGPDGRLKGTIFTTNLGEQFQTSHKITGSAIGTTPLIKRINNNLHICIRQDSAVTCEPTLPIAEQQTIGSYNAYHIGHPSD